MECVVGNCYSPSRDARRCYWSFGVGVARNGLTEHAYLDLCYFHQDMFKSHVCDNWLIGWDAVV